jgi:serine-type D-Ala-D-Ala carboxypeptidase/endopeptidase (penicillin-binding protein 4)
MIKYDFLYVLAIAALFASCKPTAKLSGTPAEPVKVNTLVALEDSLMGAHLGVMVVEAETGKVIAEHNSHKYFVPASNTKLLSMYAGLKYLPDTLIGLRYYDAGDTIYAQPTGDPTLLVDEYKTHPVMNWLRAVKKPVVIDATNWKAERYGRGWTWSDYQASYQPERSAMPVYSNLMPVSFNSKGDSSFFDGQKKWMVTPKLELGETGWSIPAESVTYTYTPQARFNRISRSYSTNGFEVNYNGRDTAFTTEIPFVTYGIKTGIEILHAKLPKNQLIIAEPGRASKIFNIQYKILNSQPLDSMLRPMMHRSDNFYAEQTLLMASNEFLGYMSDRDMIDTLMKTDFKGMPDKPVWADGSGLSRYNMFSPADFVWLLDKIKKEFGMDRLKGIMQTGNTGTLTNYYKDLTGKMYAKTGTLSGQVALSGYLYAKSGKLLLFSALVNNHNTEAARVRRQVERYLMGVWEAN